MSGGALMLSPDCSPKLLEEPCIYNRATDELYIVNQEGLDFLASFLEPREAPAGREEAAFVEFCREECILVESAKTAAAPGGRRIDLRQSAVPSLRYLLLHITERCNLRCRHCFLGEAGSDELSLDRIVKVVDEFEALHGLRLMVSGGEPLLHGDFLALNDYLAGKDLRTVLLTNGTLLDEELIGRLRFAEVQVSLDGMQEAHDSIRGCGTFSRSLRAVGQLREAGIAVSVATMIHRGNVGDFQHMQELVAALDVREWSIDLPSPAGRLAVNSELAVDPKTAGPLLARSFGGAIHEPAAGYACGAHLLAVMPGGAFAACGFFGGQPLGQIESGLAAAWQRKPQTSLAQLDCDCQFIEDCRGGCRFRAAGYNRSDGPAGADGAYTTGRDLCQCHRYGVA